MADIARREQNSPGFLDSLKNSPATQQLAKSARGLAQAQAGRATHALGGRLSSVTDRLGEVGETGQLPAVGEGAKRLLSGQGATRSAVGAATSGVAGKAKDLVKKITGKGTGRPKMTDIEESVDVGVPVSTAYNQWTQFADFSRFMKGVEGVEQTSDTETTWRTKVFKSRRTWRATIQEQVPDQRIVWTSEGPKGSTKGVVTFHPLADNLTRVLLTLEYYPSGVMEKTGNLWRAAGRRARLDLKHFRRFVMMEGHETGAWRGEIRDAKVRKRTDDGQKKDGGRPAQKKKAAPGRAESGNGEPQKREPRKAAAARKAEPRKSAAVKSAPRKAEARKAEARKAEARKSAPRKAAKKAPARKAAPQKRAASGGRRQRAGAGR